MPLMDLQARFKSKMPVGGRIRLGEKKKTKAGKEYPSDLDHFSLRDVPQLREVLGEDDTQLKRIPIFLLSPNNDIDEVLVCYYENYRSGGLACLGNGREIIFRRNGDWEPVIRDGADIHTGKRVPCPGYGEEGRHEWCESCKARCRFQFLVAPYIHSMQTFEIVTGSIINIRTLTETLMAFKEIFGTISRIPMWIERVPRKVSIPKEDGKRSQVTKHLLMLNVDPAFVRQEMAGMLPHDGLDLPLMLDKPADIEDDEADDIVDTEVVRQAAKGQTPALVVHEQPEPGETEDPFILKCAKCGKQIQPYTGDDGRTWSVSQIEELCQERNIEPHCALCLKERKAEAENGRKAA